MKVFLDNLCRQVFPINSIDIFTLDTFFSLFSLENLVAIATIASGLAAAVSSYLAVQALVEVRKQRETTYQPELILSGGEIKIYNRITPQGIFPEAIPWEYTYDEKPEDYHPTHSRIKPLPVHIYNIGLGTAKNVRVSCSINFNDWIAIFTELVKKVDGEQPFQITNPGGEIFGFRSAEYVGIGSGTLHQPKNLDITHVLPASIEKNPYLYYLPTSVLYFVSIFTYLEFKTQNSTLRYRIPHPLPDIKIKIQYEDIANKCIEKNFIVRIGISNSVAPVGFSRTFLSTEEL